MYLHDTQKVYYQGLLKQMQKTDRFLYNSSVDAFWVTKIHRFTICSASRLHIVRTRRFVK